MPGVTTTTTTSSLASGNGSLAKVRAWWRQANSGGKYTTAAIFLIPGLALFTLFVVLPMIEAGYYSFFSWNGYGTPTDFVGTRNYEQVLGQKIFHSALWHNVLVIVVSLLIQLPLAMAMALIVAEKIPGNNVFRTIFFLPYILAEIAAGLIWKFVYDGEYGLVAAIFGWFGAQAPFVLASREWAFNAILVVLVWKYFGWHMMIFIAGIQNISSEVVEAARMDGATRPQIDWYVKIPLLLPTIRLSIFFSVLGSLQLFDLIIPLTGGGPANSSHSVVSYLYYFGMGRMKIGFGSAVGVILFILCVVFAITYRRTLMRHD
jgi:raffinose/stachyose/melibiose transport system permease protein